MSYPSRRSLTSTVKQVLTDHQQYVARFWRIDCTRLSFYRFRILVVGRVSLWDTQKRPGQTNAIFRYREAPGNLHL